MTAELGNMPCDCREHRAGAPVVLDGHTFTREQASFRGDPEGMAVWRWVCSCGIKGRWRHRRSEAYHLWRTHVERRGDMRGLL